MANPTRFPGDIDVPGIARLRGGIEPSIARSWLTQESLAVFPIPWTWWRVWDTYNTNLPGTSATDDLGLIGGTFATDSPSIQTSDLGGSGAVTRYARATVPLPTEYVDGETVTLRFRAGMVTTIADQSATLDVQAYRADREAGIGADICATAATTINSTTLADIDFTITPATLAAGDLIDVRIAVLVDDDGDGGAGITGIIGAAELLVDIKG